jgi:flagellar protein FlaG
VVKAEAAPAPKIERVQLHQPQRVDLGFRAEEMRKNLQEAVTRLNQQMQSKGRDLSFSMDERIDRTIITVKNLQTGEVVRQIPTEEVVRMAHSIEDMKGVLFNQTL